MASPRAVVTVSVEKFRARFGKYGPYITTLRHPITGQVSLWHCEELWQTPYH